MRAYMKIDNFDNTLICEKDDLQVALSYFREFRKLPEHIEKAILGIVLKQLNIKASGLLTINNYLELLPEEFVRKAIYNINSMFKVNKEIVYTDLYLTYLLYYLPANVFKVWKPLLDLHLRSALKPTLTVLDIGTGPGSIPMGIIEFFRALAESYPDIEFTLGFTLIEAEQGFLDIAINMIHSIQRDLPINLNVNIEKTYCHNVKADYKNECLSQYDMITMSNFLTINERKNKDYAIEIINGFRSHLKDDGSLIIIEPGENKSCMSLKGIRNNVVKHQSFNVYAPCVSIWEEKREYSCACFNMVRSFWDIPEIYKYLVAKGLDKAIRIDVPFNYVILRIDGLRKYQITTNQQHYVKISKLRDNIGTIVNVMAIIRTAITKEHMLSLSLCDGSCSFSQDSEAVWINLTYEELKGNGIDVPLIAGEKITLKKVTVMKNNKGLSLIFNNSSRLIVEY